MKVKLVKIDYQFFLYDNEDNLIATTENSPYKRLSLKNCQAIERGYDLDELADDFIRCPEDMRTLSEDREINSFKKGFQKALELMGDKKFSLEDMKKAYLGSSKYEWFGDLIQSLQQNEWEVEILDERDSEGRLILKRV